MARAAYARRNSDRTADWTCAILRAMDEKAWRDGVPCDEDDLPHCGRCKPTELPDVVYVTERGDAFHETSDCVWLHKGQRRAVSRGQTASDVRAVALQFALGDRDKKRDPCQACFPHLRGRA